MITSKGVNYTLWSHPVEGRFFIASDSKQLETLLAHARKNMTLIGETADLDAACEWAYGKEEV